MAEEKKEIEKDSDVDKYGIGVARDKAYRKRIAKEQK